MIKTALLLVTISTLYPIVELSRYIIIWKMYADKFNYSIFGNPPVTIELILMWVFYIVAMSLLFYTIRSFDA